MKDMRILISNDDGIHAPGLKLLEKIARQFTQDVWVVAPELDQSGSGHSLTLRDPLRIREISHKKYAVNGTPTDCVMIAVNDLMKENPPHLVLSGINHGENLAEDITYSGTVAAAMEGCLLGIPSIAISLEAEKGHPAKWSTVEQFAPDVIRRLLSIDLQENVFINLNFPNVVASSVKGITVTKQGKRQDPATLDHRVDPRGRSYFWIGALTYGNTGERGTDLKAISQGYISITPITIDFTHRFTLKQLQQVFC